MSRFYGTVQGNRGQATRCGNASSGITTEAAGWGGCIEVQVYDAGASRDGFLVSMRQWHGEGDSVVIASGLIGDSHSVVIGEPVLQTQIERRTRKHVLDLEADVIDDWDSYP